MAAKKIVEVSDGKTVYGTFSSEAKAKAFQKELKAKGIPTKMYIELLDVPKEPEKPKKAKAPKKTAPAKKKPTPGKKAEAKKAPAPDLGDPRTSVKAWYAREHPDGKDFERIDPRATFGDVVWAVYDGADVYRELGPVSDSMRAEVFREIDRRNNTEDGRLDRSWKGREDKGWLEGAVTMDGVIEPPQKRKQYPGLKPEPKKEPATIKKKAAPKNPPAADWRMTQESLQSECANALDAAVAGRMSREIFNFDIGRNKAQRAAIDIDHVATVTVRTRDQKRVQFTICESEEGFTTVYNWKDKSSVEFYVKDQYRELIEDSMGWAVTMTSGVGRSKRRMMPVKMSEDEPRKAPVPRDRSDDIDLSTCSIHDLAGFLYVVQETCINHRVWNDNTPKAKPNPVHSAAEIESILSNPVLAPELCKTYLSCYITRFGQGWGGWDDSTVSYTDWKRAEARLNSIKDSAATAVKGMSEEPKRKTGGILKRRSRRSAPSGDIQRFKRLAGALSSLGVKEVPVFRSEFVVVDPDHACMAIMRSTDGRSLFGFPSGDSSLCAEIDDVLKELGSLTDGQGRFKEEKLKAVSREGFTDARAPRLTLASSFTVDADSFRKELGRAEKMMRKGLTDPKSTVSKGIRLYGNGSDLFMEAATDDGYGLDADVGDAEYNENPKGTWFAYDRLEALARLMAIAEGPCKMELDRDYPLKVTCRICGFDTEILIAPRINA